MKTLLVTLVLLAATPMATAEPPGSGVGRVGGRYLIDVRTAGEYAGGHVEGAILIPYDEIGARIAGVVTDKSAPIALYCRSGRRSGLALATLSALGYTRVENLGGVDDAQQRVAALRECVERREC